MAKRKVTHAPGRDSGGGLTIPIEGAACGLRGRLQLDLLEPTCQLCRKALGLPPLRPSWVDVSSGRAGPSKNQ
jgi:hypothetical protein